MTTYLLLTYPAQKELARFTVASLTALGDELRACNCPGLSAALIDCLLWGIERREDGVASYSAFTLRREG